jgi:dTDP-4-dehydrorhamnose reductase
LKVAVLGATGMLGREVHKHLLEAGFDSITVGRDNSEIEFQVGKHPIENINIGDFDYIINCIGLISHLIDEGDINSRIDALSLNSLFPNELAAHASNWNVRIIQIATDCVFSGLDGNYIESSIHDATDIYGRTKSLGEVDNPNVMNLRASIIGREGRGFKSLVEWVLRQPDESKIQGFTDKLWNGVTTKAFAQIVVGILKNDLFRPGLQHIVPANKLSKAKLVQHIAQEFGRVDITILEAPSGEPKDLTLSTNQPEFNQFLWESAGYKEVPKIEQMIREMATTEGNIWLGH